jgi:type IV secretory pathway VirD2 relaxase
MSRRRNDEGEQFKVSPNAPKNRGQTFITSVIRQANKAGSRARKAGGRPGARLGRGHVAARFAGQSLAPNARRVTIKTRLVNLSKAGKRSTITHLRYIEREGVGRDGQQGRAYSALSDDADLADFEQRGRKDRHQFRFIVSPEDAAELEDLHRYTRDLMQRMAQDLGTQLDWVAVDHWNTDNPHTHIVLRGRDDQGKDLIISRDYIADGMRRRACELATEWLGPRTELEIQHSLQREVEQERWTGLDRTLKREAADGLLDMQKLAEPHLKRQRLLLIGRLQCLQRMGLASERQPGGWMIHPEAERTLRSMGERGDIIRTMQRAMSGRQCELDVFEPTEGASPIIGRVAAKGLADELNDRGYLVLDGVDGKAHYVALPAKVGLGEFPVGAVVEATGVGKVRAMDRDIAVLAEEGLYRLDTHRIERSGTMNGGDTEEVVTSHRRRLEALRRAGIVERLGDDVWRVPADLPEQGRQYDRQHSGGIAVTLKSHISIERQARAIGATWLDQQLIDGRNVGGGQGFGTEVGKALQQRADFLVEEGLAERRGRRVILARNLLVTLRNKELAKVAAGITAETGLEFRPPADGERVSGVYRRSLMLTSGRFAMLDDGMGFSLVPWKPVIEQRLGRSLSAVVRGSGASWELGRSRGASIG